MEKILNKNIQVLVLYASQTGNCEQISEDLLNSINSSKENMTILQQSAKRFKLNDLQLSSNYSQKQKNYFSFDKSEGLKICVIIASSTGNGDMPENGEQFFRYLRRETNLIGENQKSNGLSHVFYTILGLGSTDYSKFQFIPRFIDQKMKILGAQSFYYRAEADDATGLEVAIEPWLDGIQNAIRQCHMNLQQLSIENLNQILCVDTKSNVKENINHLKNEEDKKSTQMTYFGKIYSVELINQKALDYYSHDQSVKPVYHIKLGFDRKIDLNLIKCGQSFALFPQNNDEDILRCIKAFGWNQNDLIGNNTVYQMIQESIDIRSQKINLSKVFYQQQISEELQKTLNEIDLSNNQYITLLDLAQSFENYPQLGQKLKVPQFLIEEKQIIPRIKPRFYSIINDPEQQNNNEFKFELQIIISETKIQKNEINHQGFCTNYLLDKNRLDEQQFKIKCQFSQAYRIIKIPNLDTLKQFELKQDVQVPIIMVANGTGIAPFISILKSILNSNQVKDFRILLLYGVRDDLNDFIFQDFIQEYFKKEQNQLILACSRKIHRLDENERILKKEGYVQDVIQNNIVFNENDTLQKMIRKILIDQKGYLMICGNKKGLGNKLNEVFLNNGILSEIEMNELKQNGQIMMELWGE